MKSICLFIVVFICSAAYSQTVVDWVNTNAIVIEDATAETPPALFAANVPQKFKEAKIFGFGEATHHGKEFFEIKAKFFKYLVENQGVTDFIMEECYQAEHAVNNWIAGGEGNVNDVISNFNQGIWYCREVTLLLQWIRDYNAGKPVEKQIRFYGMDNQFGHDINKRLRDYIAKNNIVINENLIKVADSCSAAKMQAKGNKGWADRQLPKLAEIKKELEKQSVRLIAADKEAYYDMQRGLGYLEQYTGQLQNMRSENRDNDMYNNVVDVIERVRPGSKAFIWAHNEHINKHDLYGYELLSTGTRLKQHYGDAYYAVGFDFGTGKLKGYDIEKGKVLGQKMFDFEKPYKKTTAETLIQAKPDVYFIDMDKAKADATASGFFSAENKVFYLGGPGYDPKKVYFVKRRFSECYDGLIFIKHISPPTPYK